MDNLHYNLNSKFNSNVNFIQEIKKSNTHCNSSSEGIDLLNHSKLLNKSKNIDFSTTNREIKYLFESSKNNTHLSLECSIDRTNNTENESLKCNMNREPSKDDNKYINNDEYIIARNQLSNLNVILNYNYPSEVKIIERNEGIDKYNYHDKDSQKNLHPYNRKRINIKKSNRIKQKKLIFKVYNQMNSKDSYDHNFLYHHVYGHIDSRLLKNCEKDWGNYLSICESNSKHRFIKTHFKDSYSLINYYHKFHVRKCVRFKHIPSENFKINYKNFPFSKEKNDSNLLPKKVWDTSKFDKNLSI